MAPNGKGYGDSIFLKEKHIAEEVRAIGFDFDCVMISASQLEKHATEKINNGEKISQSSIQGRFIKNKYVRFDDISSAL